MLAEGIEINKMAFAKEGRNSTQVIIKNERKIGNGWFSDVYQADVAIGNHTRKFVIKKFKDALIDGKALTAKENAANAIVNYQSAKKAGLKVFTTYRLSEDGTSILMTNGSPDSTVCLTNNEDANLWGMGLPKIKKIEEAVFKGLVDKVFRQAIIAAEHDLSIWFDAFFFLYDRNTNSIDFVVGDLDLVNRRQTLTPRLHDNLADADRALGDFVQDNVQNPNSYYKIIDQMCSDIKNKQGYI